MLAWIIGGVIVVAACVLLLFRPTKRFFREVTAERAHELFHLQREMLEAKFLELARSRGNPKGVVWSDCDYEGDSAFARHIKSGELVAFVEVTVHFEPVESGRSSDTDAIGANRQATAVFHYHHGQWGTSGRVLFDMTPAESLDHFSSEYERLAFDETTAA